MSPRLKNVLRYTISFLIGLALVYWVFKGVDLNSILSRLGEVNYYWIIASVLIGLFSHYLRAVRWNLLLEPIVKPPKIDTTFPVVMSMYFVNLIIPRGGEVFRCGALKKTDNIPVSTSFGTVVAERFFDMILLLAFLLIMVFVELDKFNFLYTQVFSDKVNSKSIYYLLIAGGVLITALLIIYLVFASRIKESVIFIKVKTFVLEILKGLTSYRMVKNKLLFWVATILIWVAYFFMSYIVIFSISETANLSFEVGFMLLVLGGAAMATPVQGGIGAFHILVSQGLALYGLSKESGLFFATILHGAQFLSLLIAGSICIIYLMIFKFNKTT
ncbi:MAG: lysylphosphatidylglycerol synthase transmembrane domain-containing protein [Bacteroidota bacterium]